MVNDIVAFVHLTLIIRLFDYLIVFPIFLTFLFLTFLNFLIFAHQATLTVFQSDGAIHFLEVPYNPSKRVSLITPNIKIKIFSKYFIFN